MFQSATDTNQFILKHRSELLKGTVSGYILFELKSCKLFCEDFFLSGSDDNVSGLKQLIRSAWEVAIVPTLALARLGVMSVSSGYVDE